MPVVDEEQIKSLLADGSITGLTLDTSVFDQKRLQFNSATLQALTHLKNRPFEFILSQTVVNEVFAHLKKDIENALQEARKSIGKALYAFETEEPTRDEILESISRGQSAEELAARRLQKYIEDTGCEVLNDAVLVETATLFDGYFSGAPPFGPGRKRDEFPDALALHALERAATDRGTCILVVSRDGDWRAFCERSERLYAIPEIEKALNLVTDAPLGLRAAILAWMSKDGSGHAEVQEHIALSVSQMEFNVSAIPSHGEVELNTWEPTLQRIDWPDDADIDIIEIIAMDGDAGFTVVLSLPLTLTVSIPIEMDFSVWDSVDRESLGMGGRREDVMEELHERATMTIDVLDLGTENEDIVCYNIELEGKYHEIDLGEVDMFRPEDYWDGDESE